MLRIPRRPLPILGLLGVVLLAACEGDSPGPGGGDPVPESDPRATAAGLLDLFAGATSDTALGLESLADCLHEDFRFYFTAEDRAGDPSLPEFWTRAEFLATMANMMAGALDISLELAETDTLAAIPCTAEPGAPACQPYELLVDLAVLVPEEPENRTYLVHGFADIRVTEDPPAAGLWRIHRIVDRTSVISRLAGTEATTWGAVLGLYR